MLFDTRYAWALLLGSLFLPALAEPTEPANAQATHRGGVGASVKPDSKATEELRKQWKETIEKAYTENYVDGAAHAQKSEVAKLYKSGDDLWEQAKKSQGNDPAAQAKTSHVYDPAAQAKFNQAIDFFSRAIAAFDKPEEKALYKNTMMANFIQSRSYMTRCSCYLELKDYDKAISDATQAIRFCPDYYLPYQMRARAYTEKNDAGRAEDDSARAKKLHLLPDFLLKSIQQDKDLQAALSRATPNFSQAQMKAQQEASYRKYYVNGAKGQAASKMEKLNLEGRSLMHSKKYPDAVAKFSQAITAGQDPKEKALYKIKAMFGYKLCLNYQCRAYCLLMMKDYQKALDDLNEAIKLRPDWPENYINRGKALKLLGRSKEAQADLEKASRMKPATMPDF
jgi:tetratricopeptide (TPR) repeat protein